MPGDDEEQGEGPRPWWSRTDFLILFERGLRWRGGSDDWGLAERHSPGELSAPELAIIEQGVLFADMNRGEVFFVVISPKDKVGML